MLAASLRTCNSVWSSLDLSNRPRHDHAVGPQQGPILAVDIANFRAPIPKARHA